MSKFLKFFLAISVLLVIGGAVLFVVTVSKNGFSFNTVETVLNNHEVTEDFSNINITTHTADIIFKQSEDDKCKVECLETEKEYHTVEVKDDSLNITIVDERKFEDKYMFNFVTASLKITISLPKTAYNELNISTSTSDIDAPKEFTFTDVKINNSTGKINLLSNVTNSIDIVTSTSDVRVENSHPKTLNVKLSTGDIVIKNVEVAETFTTSSTTGDNVFENVKASSINIKGGTGHSTLKNVIASGHLELINGTGRVTLDRVDGDTIKIKTSTGRVTGTILTSKSFYAKTSTGSVDVPKTTGNLCEIETSTGDISIKLAE